MEGIKEMLKTTPEHILKARDIAQRLYTECPDKQREMLAEIKATLIVLNENNVNQIKRV